MPIKTGRQFNSTLPRRKFGMKRSGFKPRRFGIKAARNTKPSRPKSAKRGPERKVQRWDRVRAKLKPIFEKAGITCCELWMNGCLRNNFLGFAHSLKRRNITTNQEMEEVILACASCHDAIEGLGEKKMRPIVKRTIAARENAVERIFEKIEETY